jgi:hypothetical protein
MNRLNRLSFCAALSLLSLQLFAAAPAGVRLKLDAADLLPGSGYELEVRSYYTLANAKTSPSAEELIDTALPANEVYRAKFVAPRIPQEALKEFVFRFATPLPATPPRHVPRLIFQVNLKVTPPKNSGMPTVQRTKTFATGYDQGIVERCFRLRGPLRDGFFYVGVADCKQPIMQRPAPAKRRR